MLNQVVLVGKAVEEIKTTENQATIVIAVSRSFKNEEGLYESDNIPVVLYNGIMQNAKEYCNKGTLIGIKGRIQMIDNSITIIAERITFLSSKKED